MSGRCLMTSTRTVSVNAEELRTTFEFVSFGAPLGHSAYICVDTGKIYCHSLSAGLEEEDLPEDLETSDHYIAVPQERPGPRPASRASLRRSRIVRRIQYRCRFFQAERGLQPFQGIAPCPRHAGAMVCIRKPCDGRGPPRMVRRKRHSAC